MERSAGLGGGGGIREDPVGVGGGGGRGAAGVRESLGGEFLRENATVFKIERGTTRTDHFDRSRRQPYADRSLSIMIIQPYLEWPDHDQQLDDQRSRSSTNVDHDQINQHRSIRRTERWREISLKTIRSATRIYLHLTCKFNMKNWSVAEI